MKPFDIWDRGIWFNTDVAGTHAYQSAIEALLPDGIPEDGRAVEMSAQLVPEPANKVDANAVQIVVEHRVVGHLSAEDAIRFRDIIASIVARGLVPRARVRLWATLSFDYDFDLKSGQAARSAIGIHTDLKLALPEPHLWGPINTLPTERWVPLPFGRSVQVRSDDGAQTFFISLVRPEGESWLYATLHRSGAQTARQARESVEVRVNGTRVGQLTSKMSGEFLPVLAELGRTLCVVPALLRGNRLKADLTVHAARAGELTPEWLVEHTGAPSTVLQDAVGPAVDRPLAAVAAAAQTEAGWYPDPEGVAPLRYWDGAAWTSRIRMK